MRDKSAVDACIVFDAPGQRGGAGVVDTPALGQQLAADIGNMKNLLKGRSQLGATLDLLEAERDALDTPYWHGDRIGHADSALACAIRHLREILGEVMEK